MLTRTKIETDTPMLAGVSFTIRHGEIAYTDIPMVEVTRRRVSRRGILGAKHASDIQSTSRNAMNVAEFLPREATHGMQAHTAVEAILRASTSSRKSNRLPDSLLKAWAASMAALWSATETRNRAAVQTEWAHATEVAADICDWLDAAEEAREIVEGINRSSGVA